MEKATVWTNDFYYVRDEVDRLLAAGKAVRVGADCTGHTLAAMVKNNAERYFESIGAVEVARDWTGAYYALPMK